jgi:hypothetical protein
LGFEKNGKEKLFTPKPLIREVDLVLEGEDGKEIWYEFKSYKDQSLDQIKRNFSQWKIATDWSDKKDTSNHRQFFLDCVALASKDKKKGKGRNIMDVDEEEIKVERIAWRFQKFIVVKPKATSVTAESIPEGKLRLVRSSLAKWPLVFDKTIIPETFGIENWEMASHDTILTSSQMKETVKLNDLKTLLLDNVKDIFFAGMADDLLQELMD